MTDIRLRARRYTSMAIKKGYLVRKPCEVCGCEPGQAHHEDYLEPLKITWLCPKHHAELHTRKGREKKEAHYPKTLKALLRRKR
jgi:hypothetical protein